ncbi:MAG: glycerol dehydrogenase [Bacteroidales bacterium]
MHIKAVFPGQYIQGPGVLNELPGLVGTFGSKGLILGSKTVSDRILPRFGSELLSQSLPIELFGGECCEPELGRVARLIAERRADILIGMGGGKTIDTAKIAADRAGIPVIVVPTIASTDAPCSGCAVLYGPEGTFEAVHYQKRNPAVVLVDVNIIAHAPVRFLAAGMGDALATWFEARSCKQTQSVNECGGLSTMAGLHLARLCYDTLMSHGVQALSDNQAHAVTQALNCIVEANILLSGLGFESGGLAAAHAIHNGLTALDETHGFFHGEKVAFGLLAGLHLEEKMPEETDAVYHFCHQVGLPTTLADIGLGNADPDYLMMAAEKSCAPDQPIHHQPGTITPEKVLQALLRADERGRASKA